MPVVQRMGGQHPRIVLTGAGGGVWAAPAEELAGIAVDSVTFCRRIASRLSMDQLRAEINSDSEATLQVLTHLASLALD